MTVLEYKERIGLILSRDRERSGMSQSRIASMLGMSRSGVQGWESGLVSVPLRGFLKWYVALGLNPLPALKELLYGDDHLLPAADDRSEYDRAVQNIMELTYQELKIFNYLNSGIHGSIPYYAWQEIVSDLQCPVGDRDLSGIVILSHWENSNALGRLNSTDILMPDMAALQSALHLGRYAHLSGSFGYVSFSDKYRISDLMFDDLSYSDFDKSYMARKLGVSKDTLTNWKTYCSIPSLAHVLAWYDILCISPIPAFKICLYGKPEIYTASDLSALRSSAIEHLNAMDPRSVLDFNYLSSGAYGGSVYCFWQKIAANIQCTIGERYIVAVLVRHNWQNALSLGNLHYSSIVPVDTDAFDRGIALGKNAHITGMPGYN